MTRGAMVPHQLSGREADQIKASLCQQRRATEARYILLQPDLNLFKVPLEKCSQCSRRYRSRPLFWQR